MPLVAALPEGLVLLTLQRPCVPVQHSTMESLLERGEKIDDLVSKSEVLGIHSKAFYKTVRTGPPPLHAAVCLRMFWNVWRGGALLE